MQTKENMITKYIQMRYKYPGKVMYNKWAIMISKVQTRFSFT